MLETRHSEVHRDDGEYSLEWSDDRGDQFNNAMPKGTVRETERAKNTVLLDAEGAYFMKLAVNHSTTWL